MSSEKSLTPQIRFKGFTEAWEQRKVFEIANRLDNLRVPVASNLRIPGNTPYYGANGIQDYVSGYTHDGEFVLVAEDGANDLKNYPVQYVSGQIWVNNHAHVLQGLERVIDNRFLSFSLVRCDIEVLLVGGGRSKLNANTLMNELTLSLPNLNEQKNIGELFFKLDDLITLHQRKLDALKKIKSALLEKMFPKDGSDIPEIRFAGFTEAWEQRKLSDIADRITTISNDSCLPRVEYEDINSGFGTLNKNLQNKKSLKTGVRFQAGDCLYGKLRPYLMNWLNPQFNGIAVGDFWVLRPSSSNEAFLYSFIQSDAFQFNANISCGSKMPRADWSLVSEAYYFIPSSVDEQKFVGVLFKQTDSLITLHQRKLDALKKIKSALLEKMFV